VFYSTTNVVSRNADDADRSRGVLEAEPVLTADMDAPADWD